MEQLSCAASDCGLIADPTWPAMRLRAKPRDQQNERGSDGGDAIGVFGLAVRFGDLHTRPRGQKIVCCPVRHQISR